MSSAAGSAAPDDVVAGAAMLLAAELVVVTDAELLLEHPDKPTSRAAAARLVAATVLARLFVIGSTPSPWAALCRDFPAGQRSFGDVWTLDGNEVHEGARRHIGRESILTTSAAGSAPNTCL